MNFPITQLRQRKPVNSKAQCFLAIGSVHTVNEPYQSSFGTIPRPPLQLGLDSVVWSAPEYPKGAQKVRTKGGNELEFDSIEPKVVNTL